MKIDDLEYKYLNASLSNPKKNIRFIELLLKHHKIELNHDVIRAIIYNKMIPKLATELYVKYTYLTYEYLISSNQLIIDKIYLQKIYFLFTSLILEDDKVEELIKEYYKQTTLSSLEKAISFHYYLYKSLDLSDTDKEVFSLLFLMRELVKLNLSTFKILNNHYEEYLKAREEFFSNNNLVPTIILLERIYENDKIMSKEYIDNLDKLDISKIRDILNDHKELLDNYGITSISLFGSFAKGSETIISDVDLFINTIVDVSYDEKMRRISTLKDILSSKLNRFVDIQELSNLTLFNILKEVHISILLYQKG